MKEILTERPQKVVVSKGAKGWFVTITLDVTEVDGGFECDYFVVELDHRPVMDDVRTAIINHINAETDGQPVYHTFKSMNAFTEFYTGAIGYIQQMLTAGWIEKDAVDEWLSDVEL